MFLGVNMFLALLRTHFSPHQNEPESGQKHIYAREHQLYCYIISATQLNNTFRARWLASSGVIN